MDSGQASLWTADAQAFLNVAACVGIVAVLWGLAVTLCRERVKTHLRNQGCQPTRIWWRPLASSRIFCRFEVRYQVADGILQHGRCAIEWLRGEVVWETKGKDESE
jgi:hypothetical protein